jgi:hypothetical protein
MKEIELLKTYNDWRRGSDIQQPNPTEIGHSIDFVLNELKRLRAQNDELRANNSKLRESLRDACMYLACTVDISKYNEALESTPTQSLADIRAEAVMDAAKHIKEEVMANETYYTVVVGRPLVPISIIEEYANKIKGGEL